MGTAAGVLRLRDSAALSPLSGGGASGTLWLVHDGSAWVELPNLTCRAATPAEAETCTAPSPPRFLTLGGEALNEHGPAAEFAGLYELQAGHVNMQPAYRRVRAASGAAEASRSLAGSLWLVRGRTGCWVGQRDSQLSRDAGCLQRAHTGYILPSDAGGGAGGGVGWQEYATNWRDVPQLVCSVPDEGTVTAMLASSASPDVAVVDVGDV